MNFRLSTLAFLAAACTAMLQPWLAHSEPLAPIELSAGWQVEASSTARMSGAELSSAGANISGWLDASAPSSVVSVMLANGRIADPFPGMNLRAVPGTTYPIGIDFFTQAMPEDSPFRQSWWYRIERILPDYAPGTRVHLAFDGINNAANVWVNGTRIAQETAVRGAYRTYEFDVTSVSRPGKPLVVALEIFAPTPNDLSGTWVDWNPVPGDKGLGLSGSARIVFSGPVRIGAPWFSALVPKLDRADLRIGSTVTNESSAPIKGRLIAELEGRRVAARSVMLTSGQHADVVFDASQFPDLSLSHPRLWWPVGMGTQELYDLKIRFESADGVVSDETQRKVGIRQITSEISPATKSRLFRVNGRPLFVRGGGWSQDLLGRRSLERAEAELRYVRDLGLNLIRMEGKFENDAFLELTDRYGILVMAGLPCCSHWEDTEHWTASDRTIAEASLRSQLKLLRAHPSALAWLYGSDNAPVPAIEKLYLKVLGEEHWPNPSVAAASATDTTVGPTGFKMTGPYDYEPPSYWSVDKDHGGAHGFNTETSVGPAVPPLESLKKMLTPEHLWPIDETWNFHAGENEFKTIDAFRGGLAARYGEARGIEDFVAKAQAMAYEGHRAMFEAYARQKYVRATGVIQWMLNNAWPSLIWHLFDHDLNPGGSYFGAKKANAPLHLQYGYDDDAIVLVSQHSQHVEGLKARIAVYDFNLIPRFSQEISAVAAPDSSQVLIKLPAMADLTPTYFVKLELLHGDREIEHNFYWLSTRKEVFDWGKTEFNRTPILQDGDLSALSSLEPVRLEATARVHSARSNWQTIDVTLKNASATTLAFMARARLLDPKTHEDVLPILWSDNYVSLLPGETRTIQGRYEKSRLGSEAPLIRLEGWNIQQQEITSL